MSHVLWPMDLSMRSIWASPDPSFLPAYWNTNKKEGIEETAGPGCVSQILRTVKLGARKSLGS